jgi:hypothetical protein
VAFVIVGFVVFSGRRSDAKQAKDLATVRRVTIRALQPYLDRNGITRLADSAEIEVTRDRVLIAGQGYGKDGKMHDVIGSVAWATFGDEMRVEVVGLIVDGEVVELLR